MLSLLSLVLFLDNEVQANDFRVEVIEDDKKVVENVEINRKEILVNTAAKYGYTRQNRGLEQRIQEYGDGLVIEGMPNAEYIAKHTASSAVVFEFIQMPSQTRYLSFKSLLAKGDFRSFFIEKNIINETENLEPIQIELPSSNKSLIDYLLKIDARGR